jgi:hypothetical protein
MRLRDEVRLHSWKYQNSLAAVRRLLYLHECSRTSGEASRTS